MWGTIAPTASAPKPTHVAPGQYVSYILGQLRHGQIVTLGEIAEHHSSDEGGDEAAAAQHQREQVAE